MEAPKPTKELQYIIEENYQGFFPMQSQVWHNMLNSELTYDWGYMMKNKERIEFDTLEEAKVFIEKVKELPKYHTV